MVYNFNRIVNGWNTAWVAIELIKNTTKVLSLIEDGGLADVEIPVKWTVDQ